MTRIPGTTFRLDGLGRAPDWSTHATFTPLDDLSTSGPLDTSREPGRFDVTRDEFAEHVEQLDGDALLDLAYELFDRIAELTAERVSRAKYLVRFDHSIELCVVDCVPCEETIAHGYPTFAVSRLDELCDSHDRQHHAHTTTS